MSDKPLKPWNEISADELHHRHELQNEYHEKPIRSVVELIESALRKVLKTLGIDVTQDTLANQQEALGIIITEQPPEEMGKLSGFYVIAGAVPIAIIGDAYMAQDGLAWIDIHWIQKMYVEKFGGIRILQS